MENDDLLNEFEEFEKTDQQDEASESEENPPLLNLDDLTEDLPGGFSTDKVSPSAKIIKQKDIDINYPKFGEEEAEAYLKEDYEQAKKKKFSPSFIPKEEDTEGEFDQQEFLIKNFKDFLVVPKIAGKNPSRKSRNVYSKEEVEQKEASVEISNNVPFEDVSSSESSVIVNRGIDGEIESLEVYCKDGEKILIRFDFGDEEVIQK